MTTNQTSKLNMYKSVKQLCETNPVLFAAVPAVAGVVEELSTMINRIDSVSLTQGINTTGITQDKNSIKQNLGELAVEVSGAVVAYAVKNKNNELRMAVDYSVSDIIRTKDADAIHVCRIILEKAQSQLTGLIHYGVNASKLNSLQASINAYSEIINKKQGSKITKVAATKDLDKLFLECDLLLKDVLDRLVFSCRKSDVNFYNKYTHARQIVEAGKRSKSDETSAIVN